MNDTKQLIKAITDLTKAVNKNTESIRENTNLNQLDINTVESGTPDGLKQWYKNQRGENMYGNPNKDRDLIAKMQNELNKNPMNLSGYEIKGDIIL